MRIIRIWPHVSRETLCNKKSEKKLDFPRFLARGRQCESEVENLWVAEAIENVCVRMSSLSQAWADLH